MSVAEVFIEATAPNCNSQERQYKLPWGVYEGREHTEVAWVENPWKLQEAINKGSSDDKNGCSQRDSRRPTNWFCHRLTFTGW